MDYLLLIVFFYSFNTKNSRPISEKITKDIERDRMEKELELERIEKEKFQRENEEMKKKLSQLTIVPSSTLQVNQIEKIIF